MLELLALPHSYIPYIQTGYRMMISELVVCCPQIVNCAFAVTSNSLGIGNTVLLSWFLCDDSRRVFGHDENPNIEHGPGEEGPFLDQFGFLLLT
jgi:hypothetical protein